jgi:hypothetical protein
MIISELHYLAESLDEVLEQFTTEFLALRRNGREREPIACM